MFNLYLFDWNCWPGQITTHKICFFKLLCLSKDIVVRINEIESLEKILFSMSWDVNHYFSSDEYQMRFIIRKQLFWFFTSKLYQISLWRYNVMLFSFFHNVQKQPKVSLLYKVDDVVTHSRLYCVKVSVCHWSKERES